MKDDRNDLLKRREWAYADIEEIDSKILALKKERVDLDIEIININQRMQKIEEGEK